jgi:hypothetical protein
MPANITTVFGAGILGGASGGNPRASSIDLGSGIGTRLLLVCLFQNDADGSDEVSTLTIGGESLTLIQSSINDATQDEMMLYGVVTALTGTQSLSGSFTGDAGYALDFAYCVVDDVDPATAYGSPATAVGNSTAPAIGSQTCPANGLVVGFMGHRFSTPNPSLTGTGATSHVATRISSKSRALASRNTTGAFSWSVGSAQPWGVIALPVNGLAGPDPVIAGPASHLNRLRRA